MAAYRFFKVEEDHVVGSSLIVHCDDDKDAIRKAKEIANGVGVEVWDSVRRVIRIDGLKEK